MKTLFNIFLLGLIPILSSAQMSLGIKAGANFSQTSLTDDAKVFFNSNFKPGYQVGAFLDIPFGGMFGVQAEVFYLKAGSRYESIVEGNVITFLDVETTYDVMGIWSSRLNLDYLDIPIMLKYNFRGRSVSSYLMAGPHLRFATGASMVDQRVTPQTGTAQTASNRAINIGSGPNRSILSSDFGISIGGGLAFELDYGFIVVDARYYLGMTNIRNSKNPAEKMNNRTAMINVGYMFPLGGY
jgi:hypothetical protein